MADKKLNELTAVSDYAYKYVETADGSQAKISKADDAAVVAEQYKVLTQMNGLTTGGTVSFNTGDLGIKDHYVLFRNVNNGYNSIVQIRYGAANVVHESNQYYTFSVAANSDTLTITILYNGTRSPVLSYKII